MYMKKAIQQNIHLLLPEQDLRTLKRQSRLQKQSVAALIRDAIRKTYGGIDPDQRSQALQRLLQRDELKMENWKAVKKDLLKRYE